MATATKTRSKKTTRRPAKKRPQTGEVRAFKSYDTEYLGCRYFNHAWRFADDQAAEPHPRFHSASTVVAECIGCGTRRVDYILRDGEFLTRKYEYVEGYQIPNGREVAPKQLVRREYYRRQVMAARARNANKKK